MPVRRPSGPATEASRERVDGPRDAETARSRSSGVLREV